MELRKHDVMSPTVRAYEAGCLALAGVLVLANFVRLSGETRVLA